MRAWGAVLAIAALAGLLYQWRTGPPYQPSHEQWTMTWGASLSSNEILPYEFSVHNDDITDLVSRLKQRRDVHLPSISSNWTYGAERNFLEKLRVYWQSEFEWTAFQDSINSMPHFHTVVSGLDLHFVDVRADRERYSEVQPLLLLHGWPSSFYNFQEIIPMLSDPRAFGIESNIAFDCVVPSLPGFGFSESPSRSGLGPVEIAVVLAKLMARVHARAFFVHGGDWGALIASAMGQAVPDLILGLHVTFFPFPCPLYRLAWVKLFGEERDAKKMFPLFDLVRNMWEDTGYLHFQATKPDTLAVAMADSPLGLAAYVVDKYHDWSHLEGNIEKTFTLKQLCTQLSLYWFTNSMGTAMRLYKEALNSPDFHASIAGSVPASVPTGIAEPNDGIAGLDNPKGCLTYRYPNIVHHTRLAAGGHFAEMEKPLLLSEDLRAFVEKVLVLDAV